MIRITNHSGRAKTRPWAMTIGAASLLAALCLAVYPGHALAQGRNLVIDLGGASPIPRWCEPIEGIPPYFVLTEAGVRQVSSANEDADYAINFSINGIFSYDLDGDGGKEAYGLGRNLTEVGADNSPDSIESFYKTRIAESQEFRENFQNGLNIDPRITLEDVPTLLIRLDQWSCHALAYQDGNIARESTNVLTSVIEGILNK
jgi:hypothetical protein